MKKPVTIYAEMTPNPNTMKFVADHMLVDSGNVVEFLNKQEAIGYSSLAEALFNFPFVTRIFIANNFVTVYKNDVIEWDDVALELREFIKDWLMQNDNPVESIPDNAVMQDEESMGTVALPDPVINTEMDQKIVDLINEYVQPAVEQDGGAIHFQSYNEDNGQVTCIIRHFKVNYLIINNTYIAMQF